MKNITVDDIRKHIYDMMNENSPKIEELLKLQGEDWREHREECTSLISKNSTLVEILKWMDGREDE